MADGWTGPPPSEICIVMLSALGDAVHVLPVASALKRHWPGTRITWIVQPVPAKLVEGHPAIDELLVFRRRSGPGAWRAYAELRDAVHGRRFDLALGLQVYFKAGVITAMLPARVKLGFDRARARDAQWLFTSRRIPPRAPQHVQDQYFEFLHALGLDEHPVRWNLAPRPDEREPQERFFAELGRPACAIVVGTSKPQKNWDPERYVPVVEAIHRDHGLQPVLVGGPSPLERAAADHIRTSARVPVVDALGDDVRRLLWLLDGSALVVSPDTGPLHIARALGRPVVGLFGYTNPKRTGPYRAYEDLVVDGYAEYPGEDYPLTHRYRNGMGRVTPEAVLEKVALAMERYVRPR